MPTLLPTKSPHESKLPSHYQLHTPVTYVILFAWSPCGDDSSAAQAARVGRPHEPKHHGQPQGSLPIEFHEGSTQGILVDSQAQQRQPEVERSYAPAPPLPARRLTDSTDLSAPTSLAFGGVRCNVIHSLNGPTRCGTQEDKHLPSTDTLQHLPTFYAISEICKQPMYRTCSGPCTMPLLRFQPMHHTGGQQTWSHSRPM